MHRASLVLDFSNQASDTLNSFKAYYERNCACTGHWLTRAFLVSSNCLMAPPHLPDRGGEKPLATRKGTKGTLSGAAVLLTHGMFFKEWPFTPAVLTLVGAGYVIGLPIGWKIWAYYVSRSETYRTAPAPLLVERIFCAAAWGGALAALFALLASGLSS